MQAQVITGLAPTFKKNAAYLYTIDDYVNANTVLLSSDTISNTGTFTLKPQVKQPMYAFVSIGGLVYDIYLEPGKNLDITIADTAGFAKDSTLKPIEFKGAQPTDLNLVITAFDEEYNNFFLQNYKAILRKTAQKTAKDFIKLLNDKYGTITNPYFVNYKEYKIAGLLLSAYINSKKTIVSEYFNNKPVLYYNNAYMDLFNQVYEDELNKYSLSGRGKDIVSAINTHIDYAKAINVLKRDTILQNDTVRELYFVKGLGELFYAPGMTKFSVLEMLSYISKNGLTEGNRQIALHTHKKLDKLRPGTPAPNFSLTNIVSGQQVSLKDFAGKIVYLSFWDEDNVAAVQEIDLIKELEKQYGRKIVFVSICNCPNEPKTQAFINRNKYKWVFLNNKGDKKLLEDYEVLSYPAFYIIDVGGNMLKYPADKPSGNIVRTLNNLIVK